MRESNSHAQSDSLRITDDLRRAIRSICVLVLVKYERLQCNSEHVRELVQFPNDERKGC